MLTAPYPESMLGQHGLGFLFLYNVLSGVTKVKVGANDDGHIIGRLMWHYFQDAHQKGSLMSSVISILASHPVLLEAGLPRFKDTRKNRGPAFFGSVSDAHPESPLHNLFSELAPFLGFIGYEALAVPLQYEPLHLPAPSPDELRTTVYSTVEDDRGRRHPKISDCMYRTRVLESPDFQVLSKLDAEGSEEHFAEELTQRLSADIQFFATSPLECLGLATFIRSEKREGPGGVAVTLTPPFDVSQHPEADSPVAQEMQKRLEDDLKNYEAQLNASTKVCLAVDVLDQAPLDSKLAFLGSLEDAVNKQRGLDLAFVQESLVALVRWANHIPGIKDGSAEGDAMSSWLARYAGREATITSEFLIGALISTKAKEDIQSLNRFLEPEVIEVRSTER